MVTDQSSWCPDCGTWPCVSTPQAWKRPHGVDLLDPEAKRRLAETTALKGARRIVDLPGPVAS